MAPMRQVFPDKTLPDEFDLEPVRRSAAVISSRFHGLQFGIQMGRPVLALSGRPKVMRFLEEQGLQKWHTSEDEPLKLSEIWKEFSEKRFQLAVEAIRVRSRLCEQVSEKTEMAKNRLLSSAGMLPPPGRRLKNRIRELLDIGSYF